MIPKNSPTSLLLSKLSQKLVCSASVRWLSSLGVVLFLSVFRLCAFRMRVSSFCDGFGLILWQNLFFPLPRNSRSGYDSLPLGSFSRDSLVSGSSEVAYLNQWILLGYVHSQITTLLLRSALAGTDFERMGFRRLSSLPCCGYFVFNS